MKEQTSTTVTPPSSEKSAQAELEAARAEVMAVEKEVVKIKAALRAIPSATSKPNPPSGGESANEENENDGDSDSDENSLKVYATKITGLPDNCKPKIHLQLSSPIESQILTSIFDPIDTDKEGSVAIFRGVETEVATLEFTVKDSNVEENDDGMDNSYIGTLGTSAAHPVIPLCEIDFLGGGIKKKVTDLSIAIVNNNDTSSSVSTKFSESKEEEEKEETSTKEENEKEPTTPEVVEEKEEAVEEKEIVEDEKETVVEEKDKVAEEMEDVNNENDEMATKVDDVETDDKTDEDGNGTNETTPKSDVVVESDDDHFEDAVSKDSKDEVVELDEKSEESDGVVVPAASEVAEEEKEESKLQPSTATSPATTTTILLPTCSVDIRVEFNPSLRDGKDALCDLLNKASRKKAKAIDRLRKAATAMNQAKSSANTSSTMVTKPGAVRAGFLNRPTNASSAKKEPMALVRWYRRVLGPQSLLRVVFPVAKNYLLFFGGIFAMHYQGYQLALPPPV